MNKKEYTQINETLYTEVLANGLKVYLLPKPGFHKTYGLFTTNYGSIDNHFGYKNESLHQVPDGIAHFLEHKMFEKEEGDVFQVFGQQGASANAFTSFTRTSYLFSATEKIKENLETLLDFVQEPYFTKETVEKEKGIIGQEIQMYDDDPNWRQFFGMLHNLYPNHPVGIDIAGTVESIAEITAEDLYLCYQTFYHPSNMTLFIVGNIDVEETMQWISANQAQKTFAPIRQIERVFPADSYDSIERFNQLKMAVTRKKTIVGIKGLQQNLPSDAKEKMIFRSALHLLFQMLLGNTSANFLRLYNEEVIDDTFGFEFNLDRAFHFADFSTDTENPDQFEKEIQTILLNYRNDPEVNETNLALLKKKTLGKYFQSLNSLEHIANQFTQDLFGEYTLFDMPEIIQSLTLADLYQAAERFIVPEAFSRFDVVPNV
ncbi:MAG TPA: insulinase family protein [Enterococcus columbae]|nr:insulinase family protein [Enterococcus columbae]